MKYKAYPEYKETEIEWIGKIPKYWVFTKLKYILSELQSGKRENLEIKDNDAAFSIGGEHLNNDGTLKLNKVRLISKEFYNSMNSGRIQNGDILLVKDGATIGKTALISKKQYKNMAVNEHVFILRPNNKINSLLLYYLISGVDGFEQIKLTETGSAQGGISTGFADKVWFSIPGDKNEIDEISNFLDKKIAEIDTLIKKDKKLIELLQEKRTALINQVVTKGINPNARMKDSGIEWIGEIPKDWEIHRLKYISSINRKKLNESTKPDFKLNYLDISNVNSRGEILNIEELFFQDSPSRARRITKKGDTIISTVRTYLKTICYLEKFQDNLIVSTGFAVLNPNKSIESKYLYYSILSEYFVQSTISLSKGVAYPAINPSDLGGIYVLQPKIEEQQEIVNYLDKQTSKIDKTIQKIQQKINLLEEYKKSLIHHVVTGKVDVRSVEV